jgi:hypothetical protein
VADGYAVTGRAREPYYGCYPFIPRSEEIALAGGWVLLREFEGPIGPTMWRPRRCASGGAGGAGRTPLRVDRD